MPVPMATMAATRMAESPEELSLENLVRACTVRVIGSSPGAGFFIAPGKVCTCVHVIKGSADITVRWERDNQAAIEWQVTRPPLILAGKSPIEALGEYPDIAVLDVEGFGGHPCVRVDTAWPMIGDKFQVYGYPKEGGTVQLTPGTLGYRGTHGNRPAVYLDLASDTIKPGMSGAAVLNLRTGGICGVVVASKHAAQPDGALAVPWSVIESDLSDVLAANREFHKRNPAWNAAARKIPPHTEELAEELSALYEFLDPVRFTGRRRLIADIEEFIASNDHGWIVVEGEAGVGKSALAAYLAWSNGWFFHSSQFEGGRIPENARRNLAAQLTGAFELDEPDETNLTHVLRAAAKRNASEAPDRPIVLVIDTLNEIDEAQGDLPPLGLPVADKLLHKVFVVVTRRPGPELLLGWPTRTLSIEIDKARGRDPDKRDAAERPGDSNADDMREYMRSLFAGRHSDPALAEKLRNYNMAPAVFTETLVTRCAGVWIILRYVLDDVRTGRRPPTYVESLPGGVRDYYLKEIRSQRGQSGPDRANWRLIRLPALATLAALRRSATAEELAGFAGINDDAGRYELACWLDDMRALLKVGKDAESGENTYEIRHQSLRDLIAAPDPPDRKTGDLLASELPRALHDAHAAITARLIPPGPPGQRNWAKDDTYVRDTLAEHAANSGRLDELVVDPGFLLICQPSSVLLHRRYLKTLAGILAVSAYEEALNEWAGLQQAGLQHADDDERAWRLHVWARKTGASDLAVAAGQIAGRTPVIQAAVWTGTTHRLMQHARDGSVNTVTAVSMGNGRPLLASGGSDGLIRFWDPATATPAVDALDGHGAAVTAAAVVPLPDQRILLATGDRDGVVRLWRPADRTLAGEPIAAHHGAVTAITVVAYADNKALLVTCGRDRTIRLWHPRTGSPAGKPLTGHDDWVMAAAAVPVDGMQLLATGSRDGTVRFWDPRTGLPAKDPIACGNRGVNALAAVTLSVDRAVLAVGGADGTVRLWDWDPRARPPAGPPAGQPPAERAAGDLAAAHAGAVTAITVAWLAGGPLLASTGEDRKVRMWDLAMGKAAPSFSFTTNANLVKSIATVSLPDGRVLLALGGNDGMVELRELYESAAGMPSDASSTGHSRPVNAIAVAELAGRTVFVSGGRDRTVRLWDAETGAPAADPLAGHDRPLSAVAPIPLPDGGNLIATSDVDGVVRLWNPTADPPTLRRLNSYGKIYAIAPVELAGRHLLATGGSERKVRLWDPVGEEAELVGVMTGHTKPVNAITSVRLRDGQTLLATGSSDGTVQLWNPGTCTAIGNPLTGYGEKIRAVAAVPLPDGRTWFAAGSEHGKVYVWNGAERVAVLEPPPRQAVAVTAIAAVELPDRTLLATGSGRAVRLWNPAAAEPAVGTLTGHSKPVNCIASVRLPGGPTLLATGGDDKTILIWTFG